MNQSYVYAAIVTIGGGGIWFMLTDPNPEEDLSAENHSKKDVVYAEPNLSEKFVQLTEDKSNFFFRNSTLP